MIDSDTGNRTVFSDTLDQLTCETLAAYLGERFRIVAETEGIVEVILIEAVTLGSRARPRQPTSARRQPFSIVFRGPMLPTLPQRIYRLENERLGALEIFIVPIGTDDEGMRYEAVFA